MIKRMGWINLQIIILMCCVALVVMGGGKGSCNFKDDDISSGGSGAIGLPHQVSLLSPPDGAEHLVLTTDRITWSETVLAASYDVYFGTTITPTYQTNTVETIYQLSSLTTSTTYYWRIDSRNASGPVTGTVRSFRTLEQDAIRLEKNVGHTASISPLGETDWYIFNLPQGALINISIDSYIEATMAFTLMESDGTTGLTWHNGTPSRFYPPYDAQVNPSLLYNTPGGTYYIRVQGWTPPILTPYGTWLAPINRVVGIYTITWEIP